MKAIKKLVNQINEEIEGACDYAEKYVDMKAHDNKWASQYKSMAEDELRHSDILHQIAVEEIALLRKIYQPTSDMEKTWEESHMKYVEKTAWIRQMLSM